MTTNKGGRPTRADAINKRLETADMLKLRASGASYPDLATKYGITERTIRDRITRALKKHTTESADNLRILECDALNLMQRAAMSKALKGDTKSILAILQIMDRRAKYLNLHAETPTTAAIAETGNLLAKLIEGTQ